MTTIAFVGVGRMGLPMCANLVRAHHRVTAVDPDADAGSRAREIGAAWSPSIDGVAGHPDVWISMLPSSQLTIDAISEAAPLLAATSTWIDMGSNTPATSEAMLSLLSANGAALLDAPVGGGPAAAQAGILQILVGGQRQTFDAAKELLRCLADPSRITYLGTHGRGYIAKLLINLLWFGQVVASTEALLLAQRAGIDLDAMHRAMGDGAIAGRFVEHDLAALLRGDYLTSFGLQGCYDELVAVTELADAERTPFELGRLVTKTYRQALDRFGAVDGELLAAALLESRAGAQLRGSRRAVG